MPRFGWLKPVVAFCALSGSFVVCAEPFQTPGDRDLIRDRQQQLLQEQQRRLDELQQLPGKTLPAEPAPQPDEQRCFTIRTVVLKGAEHLSAADQERLVAPYRDQCLSVAQINTLLKAITHHYLQMGYVTTRAYLPAQELGAGQLTIVVVEGRLESLDSSALASSRELAMAFPGTTGEVLNLRELEQLVDQLSRLPSRQVELELAPGAQLGDSRVGLKGERLKPWRLSATRNNGDKNAGGKDVAFTTDKSLEGKGQIGSSGWSVSGYDYRKEREQEVRATVGAGSITVRNDAKTGADSSSGLNRDPSRAYEITKDKEKRTDLYVSQSSLDAAGNPIQTLNKMEEGL